MNQKTAELKKFKDQNKKAVEEKKQQHKEMVLNNANHTKKIKRVKNYFIFSITPNKQEVKQKKNTLEEEFALKNNQIAQATKNNEKELILRKQEFKVNSHNSFNFFSTLDQASKIQEVRKDYAERIEKELELKQKKEVILIFSY